MSLPFFHTHTHTRTPSHPFSIVFLFPPKQRMQQPMMVYPPPSHMPHHGGHGNGYDHHHHHHVPPVYMVRQSSMPVEELRHFHQQFMPVRVDHVEDGKITPYFFLSMAGADMRRGSISSCSPL